ncbi:unnamed protein product, partial [Rotaria magnacalcarata]
MPKHLKKDRPRNAPNKPGRVDVAEELSAEDDA